jgi:uncharacterized membrane protein
MKFIRKYFISGSLIVLPVLITFFLFLWAFQLLDGLLGKYVDNFLLDHFGQTIPGSGIIFALVLILLVGFLASHLISRSFVAFFEKFFFQFPVVKQVYPAVKQIVQFLFSDKKISFRKVVLVEYPRKGIYTLGFLTNEASRVFKDRTSRQNLINVFAPSTPNPLTGYLLIIPEDEVIEVDIPVEEALKAIISGGVVNPSLKSEQSLPF